MLFAKKRSVKKDGRGHGDARQIVAVREDRGRRGEINGERKRGTSRRWEAGNADDIHDEVLPP